MPTSKQPNDIVSSKFRQENKPNSQISRKDPDELVHFCLRHLSAKIGAFLCLLYFCEWHIHINKVGAPSRENIADKSEAKSKQARLASGL